MEDVDIDPRIIRNIFQDFKMSIEKESKHLGKSSKFSSFKHRITSEQEGYKTEIFGKGQTILGIRNWREDSIGSGKILDAVIKSYHIKNNNLVYWRSLNELNAAREDQEAVKKLEVLFFSLYRDPNASPGFILDSLKPLMKHYDAIAYLFFLKDMNHYLPIKTSHFDRFFEKVGSKFRTSGKCSWENYHLFIKYIRWVRDWLESEGIENVSLIDAHSFCWMAVNWLESHPQAPLTIPISKTLNIDSNRPLKDQPGADTLKTHSSDNTPSDDSDPADWDRRKRDLGNAAEKWVMDSEIERLRRLGYQNPEKAVDNVSKKRGLGYDIKSCEIDGTPRFIELKTIQKRNDSITFYISRNELRTGHSLKNYWIYCVLNPDSEKPEVRHFPIAALSETWLIPETYFVEVPIKNY